MQRLIRVITIVAFAVLFTGQTCDEYGSGGAYNPSPTPPPNVRVEQSDTKPPNIVVTSPANGSKAYRSEPITVTCNVYDESGVWKVEFNAMGKQYAAYSPPWQWTFTPDEALVYGDWGISATAWDNARNTSTATVTVLFGLLR
jgi:hypothetical protein